MIKIATLNLRNNSVNRKDGIRRDGKNNYEIVLNHILEEKFDILGTQELTKNFSKYLTKNLNDYILHGKYRFGNGIGFKVKLIKKFNESNDIITYHKVIKKYTKHLPSMPINFKDFIKMIKDKKICVPRIVTVVLTEIEEQDVCIINTHLDYRFKSVQLRQLKKINKLIDKYIDKYNIVLTGDFNMDLSMEHFNNFIDNLNKKGITRVEVNDKTNAQKHRNKTAIDHIFIPSNWKIINQGTRKIDKVTDHKEVYVEVEI